MTGENTPFVRGEILEARAAPTSTNSVIGWLRTNLFASSTDTAMTLAAIALLVLMLPGALNWLFFDAVWSGTSRAACTTLVQGGTQPEGWSGACWAFVADRIQQFTFGRYPADERWRPILVAAVFVALLVPLLIPKLPMKGWNALALFGVFPIFALILLYGGFGLEQVRTQLWGGLMVTLILSFVGISVSLPIGILLALGRRSNMPVISMLCTGFIEIVRGVPMISVLFMANLMLPLFLPTGWTVDNFVRALVGVSMFASAYMAEVVRGGLQAVPRGQYEGAASLGLSYWQTTLLITMPQALKLVIPGIVNTFIGLFKDTSLVSIIGMFDLLGIVRQSFNDTNWASPVTPMTGLIFAGFVFWLFCFGMSRYSAFMERHLDTSHRH